MIEQRCLSPSSIPVQYLFIWYRVISIMIYENRARVLKKNENRVRFSFFLKLVAAVSCLRR
jgi:hypothetical protein